MEKIKFVCEDSVDGIFSAIYEGFEYRNKNFGNEISYNIEIQLKGDERIELFCSYIEVTTNLLLSKKTAEHIKKTLSMDVYVSVYFAACHFEKDKGTIIFNYLQHAFKTGKTIISHFANPYVMRLEELRIKCFHESHLFKGVVRFRQLSNNILFSRISPKCNVLGLIADHFKDRFFQENFIIYDEKRDLAVVFSKGKDWVMAKYHISHELEESLAESNDQYVDLWKVFFNTVAIESRKNERCQKTLLPLWYRKNMTEFENTKK